MNIDFQRVFRSIEHQLTESGPISHRINAVIDVCEGTCVHKDWATLRTLNYDGDAAKQAEWLPMAFAKTPPRWPISGLWFGIHNPVYRGRPTADIRVAGSFFFDASDEDLTWATKAKYRPAPEAPKSSVMNSIYKTAYKADDSLKNNAEFALCLAYGALLVQSILIPALLPLLLSNSGNVGATVGFDSGDFMQLGVLTKAGLQRAEA